MNRFIILLLCFSFTACQDYPNDPEQTLNHIKETKKIVVGAIHNPPWVDIHSSPPTGSEIKLMKDFARDLDVNIEWQVVSIDKGINQLEKQRIHLLVGGLLNSTPYHQVAYSRPYKVVRNSESKKKKYVIALHKGENALLKRLEKFLKHRPKENKS